MKVVSFVVVSMLVVACGGKKTAPPASGGSGAAPDKPAAATCCCELPADPPVFEKHDSKECHEDSHGVCVADAKCTK